MRLTALLVLVPALAMAQFLPPGGGAGGGGGGGGTPDPSRNDVAVSYSATGPNGVKTAPQATPGALGACAALAGAYAFATPVGESAPSPYVCDGITWRRVWTEAEGTLPNADVVVPAYTFVSQAPSGSYAFAVGNDGARVDFGTGGSDYIYSNGTQLFSAASLQIAPGQSVTTNILAPAAGGILGLYPTSWAVLGGTSVLATCDAGAAGGLQHLTTDHRPYWCDGTQVMRVLRGLVNSAAVDPPSLLAGECSVQTVTVTGAATGAGAIVNPGAALATGMVLEGVYVSATNTVSLNLCNRSAGTVDQPSVTLTATVLQ